MGRDSSLSVAIASYNGAKFIREQLDSIAQQTRLPTELIVSDDVSTDNTVEIIREFAKTAPFPVIVIENEKNIGYGSNFLNAARRATGDYISFCDQDDIWLPNKLEESVALLEKFDADLYVHGATVVDGAGVETGRFTQGIRKQAVVPPLTLPPWGVFYGFSMVLRRELFEVIDADKRGGHTFEWSGSLSHDLWVYFTASSLGQIVVDPRPLVKYRRHHNNATPDLKGNLIRKLSQYLGVAANKNLRRDAIAAHRATILMDLARSDHPSRLRRRAEAASAYWNEIATFEAARIEIYTRERTLTRLLLCLNLVRAGGYRPYRRGGLSWRLFLKDMLFGVLQIRRQAANR